MGRKRVIIRWMVAILHDPHIHHVMYTTIVHDVLAYEVLQDFYQLLS